MQDSSPPRSTSQLARFLRPWWVTALLGVVVLAGAAWALATSARPVQLRSGQLRLARAGLSTDAASDPITFSHAVIVDQQRPGFEPDVKVDSKGLIYTSVPFGFSTTQSFVWSSRDGGNSYQLTPGNIGPGKPTTCVGGGDTDLFIDPADALYFSDLQGLTNITNSVSTDHGATWSTNCVGAPNTPDDRMWFAGTGSLAKGNLVLYQDYDATESALDPANPANSGGNQLVETVSTDGTHFLPVTNASTSSLTGDCAGASVQDCVTNNEGISGNQVVDPGTGNVFIAHTTTEGSASEVGVRVAEGKITLGTPASAVWSESPNLDGSLCPDSTCLDKSGNPEEIAGENFASIARDSAGYLYVTFTAGPLDHASSNDPNFGGLTAPEQIYVVHSLQPAGSDPSKLTWSAPQRITGSGASAGTNTFPWIVAGSDGRVAVAYYHADETSEKGPCTSATSQTCTLYGASSLTKGEWTVQLAQSLDAHDATPSYSTANVTEAPVKHGQICTNGLGCATGGDRSLGDFLQVSIDNAGAAVVSYVFDTSADTSAGEDAGPEAISRQISGPSLLASAGDVTSGGGPGLALGSVSDPAGDADYSANGSRTTTGLDNLDLTGASLANGPNRTLDATIKVRSLSSLSASPSVGGPDASWLIRWTVVNPGTTGNGHIYYVGMDNNAGLGGSGTPTFFAGDTAGIPPANPGEHTKYLTYPQTHLLSASQASYDAKTGTISLHVPLADVGNPPDGTALLSATAFTATSPAPQSSTTLFNLIDASTPFDLVIGAPGTVGTTPTPASYTSGGGGKGGGGGTGGSGGTGGGAGNGCPAARGRYTSRGIGPFLLGMTQSSARRADRRHSSHGRRHEDFFCLAPVGIRVGYGYRPLLVGRDRKLVGRTVLISTADRRYSVKGARPGERITAKLRRQLHTERALVVGPNSWYEFSEGSARGLLKVRHGRIEEIGLTYRRLTATRTAARRLLHALG